MHDEWVDVELGDGLGVVDGEPLDLQDHVDQRLKVGLGLSPHAGEQREPLDLADHAPRFGPVERGDPEGDVAEDLDQHAAQAEHHHGAEQRILGHAHDALDSRRGRRAHEDAVGDDG